MKKGADYAIEYFAEARYLAQVWELDTPLQGGQFKGEADLDALVSSFHEVHERVFAVRDEGSPVEIVNWKARLTAKISHAHPTIASKTEEKKLKPSSFGVVFFGGSAPVRTAVYKSSEILPGNLIVGPAIVEEPTATLVVYPGMSARVSGFGNYLLSMR